MKFKNWLIKKCGGYTEEEYQKIFSNVICNVKTYQPIIYNMSKIIPGDIPKEIAIENLKVDFSNELSDIILSAVNIKTEQINEGTKYYTSIGFVPLD